jgi:hypothetical protein
MIYDGPGLPVRMGGDGQVSTPTDRDSGGESVGGEMRRFQLNRNPDSLQRARRAMTPVLGR